MNVYRRIQKYSSSEDVIDARIRATLEFDIASLRTLRKISSEWLDQRRDMRGRVMFNGKEYADHDFVFINGTTSVDVRGAEKGELSR
jgi:hypothetical protein